MKRIDVRHGNSRSLLGRRIGRASYPLPAFGPYVTSAGGVLRAKKDCVKQRGVWVSRRFADGEWDKPTGDKRDGG